MKYYVNNHQHLHFIVRKQDVYCKLSCLLSQYNNSDFLCGNFLEDQAQWRDKTNGLRNLVIVNNARIVDELMKVLGS